MSTFICIKKKIFFIISLKYFKFRSVCVCECVSYPIIAISQLSEIKKKEKTRISVGIIHCSWVVIREHQIIRHSVFVLLLL